MKFSLKTTSVTREATISVSGKHHSQKTLRNMSTVLESSFQRMNFWRFLEETQDPGKFGSCHYEHLSLRNQLNVVTTEFFTATEIALSTTTLPCDVAPHPPHITTATVLLWKASQPPRCWLQLSPGSLRFFLQFGKAHMGKRPTKITVPHPPPQRKCRCPEKSRVPCPGPFLLPMTISFNHTLPWFHPQ